MSKKLIVIAVFIILGMSSSSWALVVDDFSTDTIEDYNVFDIGVADSNVVFSIDTQLRSARFDFLEDGYSYAKVAMHKTEIVDVNDRVRILVNLQGDSLWKEVALIVSDKQSWGWESWDFTGYAMLRHSSSYMRVYRINGVDWSLVYDGDFWGPSVYWLECKRDSSDGFSFSTSVDGQTWTLRASENSSNRPADANNPDYTTIKYAGFYAAMPLCVWEGCGIPEWQYDPPVMLTVDEFKVITDDPNSCEEARLSGFGLDGDLDDDCSADYNDLSLFAVDWMQCNEPTDPNCDP